LGKINRRKVVHTSIALNGDHCRLIATCEDGTVWEKLKYSGIEGFWATVKRSWYGQHHHYSKKFTPLYIAESVFKYNNRKLDSNSIFIKAMNATLCIPS